MQHPDALIGVGLDRRVEWVRNVQAYGVVQKARTGASWELAAGAKPGRQRASKLGRALLQVGLTAGLLLAVGAASGLGGSLVAALAR